MRIASLHLAETLRPTALPEETVAGTSLCFSTDVVSSTSTTSSSGSAANKKNDWQQEHLDQKIKFISLLNSSNSNRIDAKETAVVVAETDKEGTAAGTSLRFSTDVVGSSSSTQQQQPGM